MVVAFVLVTASSCSRAKEWQTDEGAVWHTTYRIVYYGAESLSDSIVEVLNEVEQSLSPFKEGSLISRINRNETDSTDALKDGKIDAAFIVAGAPTAAITELCTTNNAYLVPIDGDIADKLMADCPFYTTYSIPAGTYNGQSEDVSTVTVKATLIVSASASEKDVYELTKAIFDNADAIAAENGKGKELSIENATSGMSAPFHAGAAKYYAEKGVTVETK